MEKMLTLLAIESSCDETAVAVVRREENGTLRALSNEVNSQIPLHARYGGVVPEIASRAHAEAISALCTKALQTAGVQPDGTLVCSWDGAPVWTEIAHVETSTTGILAVTNTGEIRTHFFRASDDPGIQLNGKAVEIASSGTHHVILLEDGRVQAFGLNDAGQLNVNDWQL